MGLSIHYSGRFNKDACLSSMVNEVADFAEACKWEYQIYKKKEESFEKYFKRLMDIITKKS